MAQRIIGQKKKRDKFIVDPWSEKRKYQIIIEIGFLMLDEICSKVIHLAVYSFLFSIIETVQKTLVMDFICAM